MTALNLGLKRSGRFYTNIDDWQIFFYFQMSRPWLKMKLPLPYTRIITNDQHSTKKKKKKTVGENLLTASHNRWPAVNSIPENGHVLLEKLESIFIFYFLVSLDIYCFILILLLSRWQKKHLSYLLIKIAFN